MSQPSQQRAHPAILALGTALPPHGISQEVIAAWMAASFVGQPAMARMLRSLYAYSESVAEFKAGGGSRYRAAFLLAAEPGVSGVAASANRPSAV